MAITRDQLETTLAVHDAEALRLILHASDVDTRGAETPAALAARIADAIWWNYCTPLGYIAERSTFEDIVRHLARKLKVSDRVDPDVNVWEQVSSLTQALVNEIPIEGISIESLDEETRKRLFPTWGAPIGYGTGASSSFVTRWGTGKVLALLKTPIGRLLPLLPVIGPWIGAVRVGISAVHLVTGPLGIALAILSLNSALGTNYQRLVPLVLGIGALGPDPVFDAEIVKERDESPSATSNTFAEDSSLVSMTTITITGDLPTTAEDLETDNISLSEPEEFTKNDEIAAAVSAEIAAASSAAVLSIEPAEAVASTAEEVVADEQEPS